MGVFSDHFSDFAEGAAGDHFASLFDEWVAGVVVGEAVEKAGFFYERLKFASLSEVEGSGFVAQDVKPVFESEFGRGEVNVVGSDDRDEVHAFVGGQSLFGMDHFLKRPVAAVGREEEVCSGGFGACGVAGERAADQFNLAVHICCDAVDSADESAAAAADHSVTNFSTHDEVD